MIEKPPAFEAAVMKAATFEGMPELTTQKFKVDSKNAGG
jgi:hypothetical protein